MVSDEQERKARVAEPFDEGLGALDRAEAEFTRALGAAVLFGADDEALIIRTMLQEIGDAKEKAMGPIMGLAAQ